MSLSIDVCVMELCTGREKWLSLPTDDLKYALADFVMDDLIVTDTSPTLIDVGTDVVRANAALKDCVSLGLDDEAKICALCMASGCDSISDPEFADVLGRDFSIFRIDVEWNMTPIEIAACWLATEEYIPFGDTEMGDLVIVEDKLIEFIDWQTVWDDYEAHGWECLEINDEIYVVQIR